MQRFHNRIRWSAWTLLIVYLISGGVASTTYASDLDTRTQSDLYQQGILYYDIANNCGAAGTLPALSSGDLNLDGSQINVAQVIIGIAKTENLGQNGALIGLMAGLAESGLKDYANSNVPLSLSNPNKQAVGNDHDSLGVFQQRISMNWSTISSDPNNAAAVNQLMNPAYDAEAFFGSPPNSGAASALSKGLQNVSGWQNMQPWAAAQAVQHSAYADGSNYKAKLGQAQSLLDKYYGSTQATPLPVAFNTQGTSTASNGGLSIGCTASTQCQTGATGTQAILCTAEKYAGIWYFWGGGHGGRAAYVAACPNPSNPPNNQPHGRIAGDGTNGNPSPCAVDCSGLVSMAVDDAFNQKYDWVVADVVSNGQLPAGTPGKVWQRVPSYSQAQPGDVVTRGTEHIEIFVSYNASSGVVSTFGAHTTGTQTGPVTALGSYYDGIYRYIGPQS